MKRSLSLALFVAVAAATVSSPARAQDTAYQRWLAAETQRFRAYQDAEDRAFAKFLDREWKRQSDSRDTSRFLQPLPRVAPRAPDVPAPGPVPPPVVIRTSVTKVLPPVAVTPPKIIPRSAPPPAPDDSTNGVALAGAGVGAGVGAANPGLAADALYRSASLAFFGAPFGIKHLPLDVTPMDGKIDEKAISRFWDEMSKTPYDSLLAQAQRARLRYGLGDWPYAQLVGTMAKNVFPDENRQTLLTWFMLQKSGYRTKVGYNENRVHLLLTSTTMVYEVSFYTEADGTRFYALSLDAVPRRIGPIYTYEGTYPGATRKMDYRFEEPPHFGEVTPLVRKTLSFEFMGRKYQVNTQVEKSLGDHLYRYPRLDMEGYFDANMSAVARAQVLPQLKSIIQGRSELEATELLLHFVQTAFEYKTADEQFGFDKPYFPDEMFIYPYSDCKDRAVLFAYLVRELLGLKVIGLHFPNHLSTAIAFNTPVKGRTVRYEGRDYVMSDPTYIGAPVGLEMPQYDNVAPNIVLIRGGK